MSRIFKSNYVKVGTPKHIKSNNPPTPIEPEKKTMEVHQAASLEERANSIIEDAKQMYLRIIEEANFEAQSILQEAQAEREAIRTHAAEQGFNDGYNAGYSEGLSNAEAIIQEAAEIKRQLDLRTETMYREAESEFMSLVLDIAEKVIGQELTQNPEVSLSLIRQALAKCAFKEKLTIRVAELDFDYVSACKDKIIMLTEGINDLEIYCDKALLKGSCIVETSSGDINAGVGTQMNEIKRAFEYILRNE